MARSRRLSSVSASVFVGVVAAFLLAVGCGNASSPVSPASAAASSAGSGGSPTAAPPATDPTAPVWGFVRSDEAAPPLDVARTPAPFVQAGSWQSAAGGSGAAATVVRRDVGRYSVTFPGIGVPGGRGVAVASAVGDQPVSCHTERWVRSGSAEDVTLSCRSPAGDYADSRFTALFTFAPASYRAPSTFSDTYFRGQGVSPTPTGASVSVPPPYTYFRDDAPGQASTPAGDHYDAAGPAASISINRIGVGHYSIDLVGPTYSAREGNNLQVNAIGSTPAGCNPLGRDEKADRQTIFVGCAVGETWTDTPFVLIYTNQHAMIGADNVSFGHAFTGQEVAGSGKIVQPPLGRTVEVWDRYTANSAGKANTVRHLSAGAYEVTFPAAGRTPDTVEVIPYGEPTHRCAIGGWSSPRGTTAGDVTVSVFCVDPAGARSDTQFSLAYVSAAVLTS